MLGDLVDQVEPELGERAQEARLRGAVRRGERAQIAFDLVGGGASTLAEALQRLREIRSHIPHIVNSYGNPNQSRRDSQFRPLLRGKLAMGGFRRVGECRRDIAE